MGTLFFDKGGKNMQWGKQNLFNKWCWGNRTTCKIMKLNEKNEIRTPLNTIQKDKLKMDLRPKCKTRNYKTIKTIKKKKRFSTSLIIREMQIKTTMRFNLTLVRMTIIKKSTNNKCWRGCG